MAHFAKVLNGVVVDVINADAGFFDSFVDASPGDWIQTSYNTRGGVHFDPATGAPSKDQSKALRKNFASIGFQYDKGMDAFIPPCPYESWTLDPESCLWVAPVAMPDDGQEYIWDEKVYLADQSAGWVLTFPA